MGKRQNYPSIDMQRTGRRIKRLITGAGYTPSMIQEYLHLACVQPIYRWYKGLILPSVDHLLSLSELLGVHMEDLLVKKCEKIDGFIMRYNDMSPREKRIMEYYKKLYVEAA
ncbi:MAG: helix-turn-helix transcriptional regulator [Lachnospiraceae bacterium]|nr:helix-turn-helix transcriptional regulator [Lachnospiraceae bacterium]